MKYIPLKEANKDKLEDWIKKSNEILEELKKEPDAKKRKAIIYRNKTHWRDKGLLEFLKDLSDGKCWYTEAKFTAEYPHLEHFRPKSCARNENWEKCHEGYWWLAFDVENYCLSKPMPNVRKGTYFPLRERAMAVCEPGISVTRESPMLLDPTSDEVGELISFNALGQPEPNSRPAIDLDEWDITRVNFSIKRYGLDENGLCNRRKELWVSIVNLFSEYAECGLKAKRERCVESAGKAKRIKVELSNFLDPKHEFTSLVQACFKSNEIGKRLLPTLLTMPKAA